MRCISSNIGTWLIAISAINASYVESVFVQFGKRRNILAGGVKPSHPFPGWRGANNAGINTAIAGGGNDLFYIASCLRRHALQST
jgi:hypothetical protein